MSSLSVLLLSEDSSGGARAVLRALLVKWLYLLDPASRPHLVGDEPAAEPARQAMIYNGWTERSPKGHRKQIDLAQAILNQVLRPDGEHFVLWHMDGDCRWRDSEAGTRCRYRAFYHELIEPRLECVLRHQVALQRLRRLIIIVPYYSMEAWLFQNFAELRRIYEEQFNGRHADLDRIDEWESAPGTLEDEDKPKEQLAIRSSYNRRLAETGFPAARLLEAGKSFAAAFQALANCTELTAALEQTRRS